MQQITKGISAYLFDNNSFYQLKELLKDKDGKHHFLCIMDSFFEGKEADQYLQDIPYLELRFYDAVDEPSTTDIDSIVEKFLHQYKQPPNLILGIGGGSTLDVAKAVSNLFTNGGKAEDYQGWDLLKNPGIYKIGVPTISGTGAEASRTCVLLNKKKNIKMGMNSDYSYFDQLILDPELTASVPREQYFYTGMDTYIHCVESLNGRHRHPIADAYSHEALRLCREVFFSDDIMSEENRTKLMTASFLGGSAIANSYVGVVHPLSAALSVVFDSHHCVSNCMVMRYMQEFYPKESEEFLAMVERQGIFIPHIEHDKNTIDLQKLHEKLYQAAIVHEKPLQNALGESYKNTFSKTKVASIFDNIVTYN